MSDPAFDSPALAGGCHCGRVRYRIAGTPYHRTLCHCSMCRRTTGAPAVAWFSVPADAFELLQGRLEAYRSSETATRSFCGRCGTQITFRADDAREVDVTTCSLDDPGAEAPDDQTFVQSRLDWMTRLQTLREHRTTRDAPPGAPGDYADAP